MCVPKALIWPESKKEKGTSPKNYIEKGRIEQREKDNAHLLMTYTLFFSPLYLSKRRSNPAGKEPKKGSPRSTPEFGSWGTSSSTAFTDNDGLKVGTEPHTAPQTKPEREKGKEKEVRLGYYFLLFKLGGPLHQKGKGQRREREKNISEQKRGQQGVGEQYVEQR